VEKEIRLGSSGRKDGEWFSKNLEVLIYNILLSGKTLQHF